MQARLAKPRGDRAHLSMNSHHEPEVCEYPESDKIGVWAGEGEGALMHLPRRGAKVDYCDGE